MVWKRHHNGLAETSSWFTEAIIILFSGVINRQQKKINNYVPPFTNCLQTLSQSGIKGETCSFHLPSTFLSPPASSFHPPQTGETKLPPVERARFTLNPAWGKGLEAVGGRWNVVVKSS
jgi:hypothetical protein